MKISRLFIATLLMVNLSSLLMGAVFGQNRERIAVLPFSGITDDHNTKQSIENLLINLFVNMGRFDVVERSQLERILAEQQLSLSGMVDDSTAINVGKLAGASYLIVGSISDATIVKRKNLNGDEVYSGKVTASIRVVSSETASIVGSFIESDFSHGTILGGETEPSEQLIDMAVRNLVMNTIKPKLYNIFPLDGYIIRIQNQESDEIEALIDLGGDNGITKGDKLIVFRRGENIKHPVTGQMIPGRTYELGEAKVEIASAGVSTVKIKTKATIRIGDRVRSKEKKKSFWKTL